ncbi:hypothetical protein NX059_009153 [Plenodomus lindquistii]|nr:hypothetical protein NX059_009153 [Plenodomus lindquistii]
MFWATIKPYVFADRFIVHGFQQLVNNRFCTKYDAQFNEPSERFQLVAYAFGNIPADRTILQMLVDDHCEVWDAESELDDESLTALNALPKAFLPRVMRRSLEQIGRGKDVKESRCYMDHGADSSCDDQHMKYNERLDVGEFS